jgi:hypothetical protein
MILNDEHLADIHRRKSRFIGQWTGTAGSLAADCHHLMEDRKEMESTIETLKRDNAALREAVEERLAKAEDGCCEGGRCHPAEIADEPSATAVDWILRGQREYDAMRANSPEAPEPRFLGDSLLAETSTTPAETLLMQTLEAVRDRRPKYGGPQAHFGRTVGMINAAFAGVLKRPLTPADWALIMILDKVARYMGPNHTADGPIDMAGYAACLAEVTATP